MKYYQLTYLVSPDLSEQEVKSFQERINSLLQDEGGKIGESKNPIRKELEYPIRGKNKAYFFDLDFYLKPGNLKDLENKLKKESPILRHLITEKKLLKIEVPKKVKSKLKPKKIKKKKKVKLEKIEEKLDEILGEI